MEVDGNAAALTSEETDILVRSTKKQKQGLVNNSPTVREVLENESQSTTVVKETPNMGNATLFPTATSMHLSRKTVSYRDICAGNNGGNEPDGYVESESEYSDSGEDSSDNGNMFDEELLASWDPLCPIVKISREEKKGICIPWKRTVIIKLMGKRIGFRMLQNRLSKLWQPSSSMEIIDMENDYFLVRFSNSDDLNHVLEHGPWMILDHYLVVQRWRPEFFPFEDKLERVAVWIRIPGLPVEYYNRKILWRIDIGAPPENHGIDNSQVGIQKNSQSTKRNSRTNLKTKRVAITPQIRTKYVRKSSSNSEPQSESALIANDPNHESAKVLPGSIMVTRSNDGLAARGTSIKACGISKPTSGTKAKARVGLHDSSHVRFKGVKEAARRNASSPIATWPFVPSLEINLVVGRSCSPISSHSGDPPINSNLGRDFLGRAYASSSNPPDVSGVPIPDAGEPQKTIPDVPLPFCEVPGIDPIVQDSAVDTLEDSSLHPKSVNDSLVDWPLRNAFPSIPLEDVSAGDGNWHFDNFSDCLPNVVVNEIAGYHPACPELGNDRLIWNASHDGSFSVKLAYSVIRDFSNVNVGSYGRNLWHWRGPTRAKHFLWLTIKGGLKTNCFLWERGLIPSSLFPLCGSHDESSQHIMRDCPKVQEVWDLLLKPSRFGPSRSNSTVEWIFSNISSKGTSNGGLPWQLLFGVTCWCIWKSRNAVVFSDETWDPNKIVSTSMHLAREFVSCCQRDSLPNHSMTPFTAPVRWLPPRDGWVKWNVDGSVVGRQQQAASGCVLRDSSGRWLYGLVRNIGSSTVSCAELWAMKDATQASLLKGHQFVCFESDSTNVISFVRDGVNHDHPCFGQVSVIRSNLCKFQGFEISHINREGNCVVDSLAKAGHHLTRGLHEFSYPSSSISSSLLADCFGVFFHRSFVV
ncbi:Ribonuclease H-like superfamily [Sesbania bispinosa]|nr:Ribonuclease H-like superfamily [Sesbania bispinosa]